MYLLPSLTKCAQSNVNKIALTNPQRELSRAIVAHFRTWQKHTCMEGSEKIINALKLHRYMRD